MKLEGVQSTVRDGNYDFRRIEPRRYLEQRNEFYEEFQFWLPSISDLHRMDNDIDELHLLTSVIFIDVSLDNSYWIQYRLNPGYITDLASVPKFFRGVIDNDELNMLEGVLVHDINFSLQMHSFRSVNRLFREMLLDEGCSRFKSRLAYWAVNSIIGRGKWENMSPKRRDWTLNTVDVKAPHPFTRGILTGKNEHIAKYSVAN
jgi:hypothetical protein